jgi:iron complex transport system substrate-binding protein
VKGRALPFWVLSAFLATALYLVLTRAGAPSSSASSGKITSNAPPEQGPSAARARRVASLSPAITDTIVALGGQGSLVLVSDYCRSAHLPRGGTIISPRFERLASVQPDLILATHVAGSPDRDLSRIAPLLSVPWLTLDEVAGSIRRVGDVLEKKQEAEALARRMESELAPRDAPGAPRVLLLLGPLGEERIGYYYVRNESLHGRLLTASGYRNAMGTEVHPGQPHLSVEQLLGVNPDVILVLQEVDSHGPLPLAALTPLAAVRQGRTSTLSKPGILSMGPDLLENRSIVEATLDRMLEDHPL